MAGTNAQLASTTPGRRRSSADLWLDVVVRTVLLAILVVAGVSVLAVSNPRFRQPTDLTADLGAGRVTSVSFNSDSGEIGWTVGLWHSYRTMADDRVIPDDQADTDGSDGTEDFDSTTAERAWLRQQIIASGHRLTIQDADSSSGIWVGDVRWQHLRTLAGIAWGFALLLMLFRDRRRVANRWAWWWLFVIGGAGAPLYLLLENEPLWRPAGGPRREPPRRPLNGLAGFAYALCMAVVIGVVSTLMTLVR
jgi:hypothetical protein